MLIFAGCRVESRPTSRTIAGKDYQVVIIADDNVWDGDLSMAVCDLLEEDIPGLVRPEGYFDIVKQVSPAEASDMDRRYGLVLNINVVPSNDAPSYKISENIYARPQTIITITAPAVEAATAFIETNGREIRDIMEVSEREKMLNAAKGKPAKQLMADFKKHTGYEMLIPHNFSKANPADDELLWYIRDYKNKAQYIFAFSMEYNPESSIEEVSDLVVDAIDNKFNTISSKDVNGSYMRISDEFIAADVVTVNDNKMLELRGRWDVVDDYMGGSFTSYAIFDRATKRATVITFALYAPEDIHRNLMREMEALVYTIKQ